jgi:glyoxylase I family protein
VRDRPGWSGEADRMELRLIRRTGTGSTTTGERMRLTGVHHVTLTVTNLDRTAAWYKDVLGFEDVVRYRNDAIDGTCHVLTHPDIDGFILSFMQWDAPNGGLFDEHTLGLDHLSFGVGDRSGLEAWRQRLDNQNINCSITELPELSVLVLRDPDQIQLELCTSIVIDDDHGTIDKNGRIRLPES